MRQLAGQRSADAGADGADLVLHLDEDAAHPRQLVGHGFHDLGAGGDGIAGEEAHAGVESAQAHRHGCLGPAGCSGRPFRAADGCARVPCQFESSTGGGCRGHGAGTGRMRPQSGGVAPPAGSTCTTTSVTWGKRARSCLLDLRARSRGHVRQWCRERPGGGGPPRRRSPSRGCGPSGVRQHRGCRRRPRSHRPSAAAPRPPVCARPLAGW